MAVKSYESIWAQPTTVPFQLADLLLAYGATPSQVTEITVKVTPKDPRFSTPAWEYSLTTDASNVLWDDVTAIVRLLLNTEDFDGKTYQPRELSCRVAIMLDGDDSTTYEPLPSHDAYGICLTFAKEGIANVGTPSGGYFRQLTDVDDEFVAPIPPVGFNFPYYDVCYGLTTGADITTALQLAITTANVHCKPIVIRAGIWKLSSTIDGGSLSGLSVLGTRFCNDDAVRRVTGTTIEWNGASGANMIEIRGTCQSWGNFTLLGKFGNETGIKIHNPFSGHNVGSLVFEPINGYNLGTVVQNGGSAGQHNCDNITFKWLGADGCGRVYYNVNLQGMDIVIERLSFLDTPIGIEVDGGGIIHAQKCTVIHPAILLKINNGDNVGKYNGEFRLSNVKVDPQADDGFTLIDCDEPYPIRFFVDGGLHANDQFNGTLLKLTGANHCTIRDFTSTFRVMQGVNHPATYGRPTVLLDGCREWLVGSPKVSGDIEVRRQNCISVPWPQPGDSEWLDDPEISP